MTHAPVSDAHVASAKRAREVSDQRPKFGAPVSRQQIADFQANVAKGTRSTLSRKGNRELIERLATGEISTRELREESPKLVEALKATLDAYSKSWVVKSAVIATALRTR